MNFTGSIAFSPSCPGPDSFEPAALAAPMSSASAVSKSFGFFI